MQPFLHHSWFETALERQLAARELHALGKPCIRLLAEVVAQQEVERSKSNIAAEKLFEAGFIFIHKDSWSTEVKLSPSLWGEEALDILEDLSMPKTLPELTPLQFDILRCAITTAKAHKIQTVETLRKVLLHRWPKKPKSINEALKFWANHEKRKT